MKDFKVLSEADDSYHIQHKNGKSFTVKKSELNSKAHDEIKKLCMGGYADGGEVDDDAVDRAPAGKYLDPSAVDWKPQFQPALDSINPTAMEDGGKKDAKEDKSSFWNKLAAMESDNLSNLTNPSPAGRVQNFAKMFPAMNPNPAPVASSVAQQPLNPAAHEVPQIDPIVQSRESMSGLLGGEQASQEQYLQSLQQVPGQVNQASEQYQKGMAGVRSPLDIANEYNKKDEMFTNAIINNQIDPNRYIHSMGTGSKLLAGIGILLGGVGGGQNQAYQMLQNSINADIDSQKNDQSNKMNLWKMNREAFGNEMQANLATQNQMYSILQAKLGVIAAGSQNADQQLKARQAIDEIKKAKIQNNLQLGVMKGGPQAANGISSADPLYLVNSGMVPEDQKKQVTYELDQARHAATIDPQINTLFDQAAKDARPATGRSATSLMNTIPGYEPASKKAIKALLDPLTHEADGRVNPLIQQHIEENLPQFGDSDETIEKKKAALKTFIELKQGAPTARQNFINPDAFASTSKNPVAHFTPEQKRIYEIAKANPNNPLAQKALKKLGVK